MKTIFSICFALLSLNTFSQRTLKQLNDRLQRQPQNSSVEVISQVDNQIMTIDTFQIDKFSPQVDFNQLKIIKYNNIIQEVSREEEVIYKDKLSWNLTGNRIKIIPEFHLEIPEDSEVGEPPLIFSPIFTNLKPLIYDHEQENAYKSILTFMLFAENGEDGQKVKSPVHLEINSSRLDSFPKRFTMHHLNLPSKDIQVFTKEAVDSVDIRIFTKSAPKGYLYYLKVDPFLRLYSEDDGIQGMGIEEAEIEVQFRGSSSSEEELITIRSSAGGSVTFPLAYNESKIVKIRSQGLKDIVVSASVAPSGSTPIPDSNTLVFKQNFPFIFLGFALFGGILGVLIRAGVEGVKKYPVRMMISGILMGLLGSLTYYVLGLNLLELDVSTTFNEFAVFTFSALCSLLLQPVFFKPEVLSK